MWHQPVPRHLHRSLRWLRTPKHQSQSYPSTCESWVVSCWMYVWLLYIALNDPIAISYPDMYITNNQPLASHTNLCFQLTELARLWPPEWPVFQIIVPSKSLMKLTSPNPFLSKKKKRHIGQDTSGESNQPGHLRWFHPSHWTWVAWFLK